MSGFAARLKQARERQANVGPHAVLLPSSLLGASFVALATPHAEAEDSDVEPAEQYASMTNNHTDLAAETHFMPGMDVPPPLPLSSLRAADDEIAQLAMELAESSRSLVKTRSKKTKQSRPAAKPLVKKMTEPLTRMKHNNGNGNGHRNGNGVVHVTVKKRVPALDAPEKALVWLQGMVKKVSVAAIPTMLDYYRRLGWIPNEAYGWIVELANGLTKSAQPATWRMVKNDPAELAVIHRESYKHLKMLFGERMNRGV